MAAVAATTATATVVTAAARADEQAEEHGDRRPLSRATVNLQVPSNAASVGLLLPRSQGC